MKYYDGMGRDVTEYVAGLEKQLEELKTKLTTPPKPETVEPEEVGVLEDVKPKTRRSRS